MSFLEATCLAASSDATLSNAAEFQIRSLRLSRSVQASGTKGSVHDCHVNVFLVDGILAAIAVISIMILILLPDAINRTLHTARLTFCEIAFDARV